MPLDRVFGPGCCTREVYDQGAKEVALSVVNGVHGKECLVLLFSLYALWLMFDTNFNWFQLVSLHMGKQAVERHTL